MWAGHNRAYDLLTPENCADLIEGMKAQGQQEFPAIVRRLRSAGQGMGPASQVRWPGAQATRGLVRTSLRANGSRQ